MSSFMSVFVKYVVDSKNGDHYAPTGTGYVVLVALMLILLLIASFISGTIREKSGKAKLSTKQLVFSAVAVALATVASIIKIYEMPMGGSITLFSMLFICLIGYWYGVRTGIMAAGAYGILQLIIDPYVISVPQLFTDYIFAFGALGLSGLFHNQKDGLLKGYLAGVLGRYFFAFLSGLIFFASYAEGSGMSAPVYSLVYNGSYLGAEALLTVVLLLLPHMQAGLNRVRLLASEDN